FGAAERAAIRSLFSEFGLGECTDAMLARYSAINTVFWQRLERGELTKPQILTGRFEQFFNEYGIDTGIVKEFNDRYQRKLGDTIVFRDDSPDIIRSLKGRVKQYAVSNGTIAAQTKKLDRSGLGALMDGVFLSEELGAEKPSRTFFEKVFAAIRPGDPSEVLIVGDSLTSDILGGMNAGIRTCWYDPEGEPVPGGYRPDYVIADLHEVADCLDAETPA
ncbi:MAG: HAD-IA family hydrolase, partial [Oscillospiraceae bacterium]|nr:HAD-IA family hydrolase [Oscillospiraceae bacterium]